MPKAEELPEQLQAMAALQAMTVRGDVIQFSMLTVGESDSHVPVSFTAKRVGKKQDKNVLRGRRPLRHFVRYTASRDAAEIHGARDHWAFTGVKADLIDLRKDARGVH
jgi:hypothetical protein